MKLCDFRFKIITLAPAFTPFRREREEGRGIKKASAIAQGIVKLSAVERKKTEILPPLTYFENCGNSCKHLMKLLHDELKRFLMDEFRQTHENYSDTFEIIFDRQTQHDRLNEEQQFSY
jgi:hypothetical protein